MRNPNTVFLLFILISVGLRFFSFFPSVLGHDESTYLIIGRDILHGKSLYADVTDTKPAGIFLFYAGLEYLFGSSIFWKRFVFALVVGVTGFLLYRASKKLFNQNKVAFASGLIYIIYTSIWNYHGRSPNTELLFNFCTAAALLLFLNKNKGYYPLAGLIMGIGFMIKYLNLFDFAAFLLFFFIIEMRKKENRQNIKIWLRYILTGIAFTIPFVLTNLYFWMGDHFNDFYFVTYMLPENYAGSPSLLRYFIMLLDLTAKFLPVSFMVFYVIFSKNKPWKEEHKWFFILWIAFVFIAMYLPGKEFSHYTIQLMLPLSLLAGLFFHPDFKTDRITRKIYSKKYGIPALLILLFAIQIISFQNEVLKPDYEREIASYLKRNMNPNDKIYVSNYEQIEYYLLGIDSPTKYIHSNLLYTNTYKAFNINANTEIQRIFNTKPEFVLVQRKNEMLDNLLKKNYKLVKTFNHERIKLYHLAG